MYDFTFEDKFCKYFVNLGQLYKEVLVSFNTDKYLPRKTYKISISLFYDEKLVIEKVKKKKKFLISLLQSANSVDTVGNFLAKL